MEIDTNDAREKSCDCAKCTEIKLNDTKDYLCCNQLFEWKSLLTSEEKFKDLKCVTDSEAYRSSVNYHAVKGMLLNLMIQ